jgi:hypothetical protein
MKLSKFDIRYLIGKIRNYESLLEEVVRDHPEYKEAFERLRDEKK